MACVVSDLQDVARRVADAAPATELKFVPHVREGVSGEADLDVLLCGEVL